MHPRRKWSDWSECSSQCKKTRHRLYCDDILAHPANRSAWEQVAALEKIRAARLRLSASTDKELPAAAATRRGRRQLSGSNQNDDDDYADEGDEEGDGPDSCDKVEASKTFQEIECRGGQCRPPLDAAAAAAAAIASAPGRIRRPELDPTAYRHPQQQHQQPASSGAAPHPWLPTSGGGGGGGASTQMLDRTPHRLPVSSATSQPASGAGGNESAAEGASLPVPVWPARNHHWPQQLFPLANSELGPQASLVQWSILIGALVSVLLLIMLILRKLFVPSYHWMLAKHTLKSSSTCSTSAVGSSRHSSLANCQLGGLKECRCSPATCAPPHSPGATNSLGGSGHRASFDPRRSALQPHVVHASGRSQLIKSSDLLLGEFNTDHLEAAAGSHKPALFSPTSQPRAIDLNSSVLVGSGHELATDTSQQQHSLPSHNNNSPPHQQAAVHVFHNKSYLFNQWLESAPATHQATAPPPAPPQQAGNKSSSSISSASDSPSSIQSTTAQLLSQPASASSSARGSQQSQDNILVDAALPHNHSQVDHSPASLKGHLIHARPPSHHKSAQLCSLVQHSQPNSPLQLNHFNSPLSERHFANAGRLTSFQGPREPVFRLEDSNSEYAQPMQEPEASKPVAQQQQTPQLVRPVAATGVQNNGSEILERHFYEEIRHHQK